MGSTIITCPKCNNKIHLSYTKSEIIKCKVCDKEVECVQGSLVYRSGMCPKHLKPEDLIIDVEA